MTTQWYVVTKRNACRERFKEGSEVKDPHNRNIHIMDIGNKLHALSVLPPWKVAPSPSNPQYPSYRIREVYQK